MIKNLLSTCLVLIFSASYNFALASVASNSIDSDSISAISNDMNSRSSHSVNVKNYVQNWLKKLSGHWNAKVQLPNGKKIQGAVNIQPTKRGFLLNMKYETPLNPKFPTTNRDQYTFFLSPRSNGYRMEEEDFGSGQKKQFSGKVDFIPTTTGTALLFKENTKGVLPRGDKQAFVSLRSIGSKKAEISSGIEHIDPIDGRLKHRKIVTRISLSRQK